jgi:hypothetical protein
VQAIYKGQPRTRSPLFNLLCEWITDKHGKPVSRFQGFDLYKMLARRMACTAPLYQLRRPHFRSYTIPKRCYAAAARQSASEGCMFHLTVGRKADDGRQADRRPRPSKHVSHRAQQRWGFSDCSSEDDEDEYTAYDDDDASLCSASSTSNGSEEARGAAHGAVVEHCDGDEAIDHLLSSLGEIDQAVCGLEAGATTACDLDAYDVATCEIEAREIDASNIAM